MGEDRPIETLERHPLPLDQDGVDALVRVNTQFDNDADLSVDKLHDKHTTTLGASEGWRLFVVNINGYSGWAYLWSEDGYGFKISTANGFHKRFFAVCADINGDMADKTTVPAE